MKITISKLIREHHNPLTDKDHEIINDFEQNPALYLNYDLVLALDIKKMYDKRKAEVIKRRQMGIHHITTVTDKQLENCGVSKREFELIKKLMLIDPEIFIDHNP